MSTSGLGPKTKRNFIICSQVGISLSTDVSGIIDTIMIRRLKKDVLKELPEKNRIKVPLDITDGKSQKVLAEVQQAQKTMRELSRESLMNGDGRQRSQGFLEIWRKTGEAKIGAVKVGPAVGYMIMLMSRYRTISIIYLTTIVRCLSSLITVVCLISLRRKLKGSYI